MNLRPHSNTVELLDFCSWLEVRDSVKRENIMTSKRVHWVLRRKHNKASENPTNMLHDSWFRELSVALKSLIYDQSIIHQMLDHVTSVVGHMSHWVRTLRFISVNTMRHTDSSARRFSRTVCFFLRSGRMIELVVLRIRVRQIQIVRDENLASDSAVSRVMAHFCQIWSTLTFSLSLKIDPK